MWTPCQGHIIAGGFILSLTVHIRKRFDAVASNLTFHMVPEAGLEPARPHQTLDFESNASTDSTIRAMRRWHRFMPSNCQDPVLLARRILTILVLAT